MKNINLVVILVLLLFNSAIGQTTVSNDTMLSNVEKQLPNGWRMLINDDTLTIEKTDSIWIAHGNWYRASHEHRKLKNDSTWICKNGEKTTALLKFRLKDKMKPDEITTLIENNRDIYRGQYATSIYNSENFTLFEIQIRGHEDFENAIWPDNASKETFSVLKLLRENLERK